MHHTVQKLPKSEILLKVESEPSDIEQYFKLAAQEISKEIKIDGFRPGMAPYEIVQQRVGKEYIEMIAHEKATSKLYAEAMQKEKIYPLATADFKVTNRSPFTFEIKVATYPEVTIKNLDKIFIKKEKTEVNDKDIDDVLHHMRVQRSIWFDVDEAVKEGNRVEIDFEGFEPGTNIAVENTKSKNHPVVIGDKVMIPGFEDAILGMKKGEEKEFEITFPDNYHNKSFEKKKVLFKVKLNRVEDRKMPEIDEKFVEEASGEKMSLEDFKKKIKLDLEQEKKSLDKKKMEEKFIEELNKASEIEISDILIRDEAENLIDGYKKEAEKYKMDFDKYLQIIKKTEDSLRKELIERAEKMLKNSFLISKAFEIESIEISENEVEQYLNENIEKLPKKEQYNVQKEFKKGTRPYMNLMHDMKVKKLFEKHIEN